MNTNTNTKNTGAAEVAAKTKTPRVLYFEGAGSATEETKAVGNCRIRTAFHAKGGRLVYLELLGGCYPHKAKRGQVLGAVDFAHWITDSGDDCNNSRIPGVDRRVEAWEYTKENIIEIVRKCGGEFDAVEVADDFAGYRVFRTEHAEGPGGYNYGDEFEPVPEKIAKRREINAECHRLEYEARKNGRGRWCNSPFGGIFTNGSLWVPNNCPSSNILHWRLYDGPAVGTRNININSGTVRECVKAATGWSDETYGDFEKITKEGR